MELSQKLVCLGFTKNQAVVYSALIELGQCKAGAIIKKTNLHRNIVYEALDDLVQRKLAFKTSKGGVALFQLSDADTLLHDAEEQVSIAKDVSQEINKLRQKSTHEIKLYEGIEGLKSLRAKALADLENEKDEKIKELLVLGAGPKITENFYDSFFKKDDVKRATKQIPARMLFPHKVASYAKLVDASPFTRAKLLPRSFKEPTSIDIWKDQIAFMLYDIEPFVISIKNKQLADSFREYFEALWAQDVFVTSGLKNVQDLFMQKMLSMSAGEEYVVLGANYGQDSKDAMVKWFISYHQQRINKKISVKLLGFEEDHERLINEVYQGNDPDAELAQLRYLDKSFNSPMQINIYPDCVMMVYWALGEKAVAIEIKRQDIRDAMMMYFQALWSQDTRVHTGRAEVERLLYRKLDEMKEGDEYFTYGGQYGDNNPEYIFEFFKKYHADRNKRGIKHRIIGFENKRKWLIEEMKSNDPGLKNNQLRFLSEEFLTPMRAHIYPDSAIIGVWDYDEAMMIETTRDKVRDMLLAHFHTLWKIAQP